MSDYSGKGSFKAQVSAIVRKHKDATEALVKEATFEVIDVASTSREDGGNMPVDLGFLRSSGQASLNGLASGPSRPSDEVKSYSLNEAGILATLSKVKLGDTIYFSWSAVYARVQNYRYGYLDLAVQQWPQIVDKIARKMLK